MPSPQLVGVVALIRVPGGLAEIVEVALGFLRVVLVVAGDGLGTVLEAAPGGLVALLEVLRRALGVGRVAQGEDRAAVDATDELGGRLVALPAVGNAEKLSRPTF